jgi:predicted  nucleic acid-binding Zn-ribbon protein
MEQESFSDFSIIKNYIELKGKYDVEIKNFVDKIKALEENAKKRLAALEGEVAKRNEHIKGLEIKIQELTAKVAEKDERLKSMGLELHRLKLETGQGQPEQVESGKKKGFFK